MPTRNRRSAKRVTVLGGLFKGVYGGIDFAESRDHSAFCVIEPHQPQNPEWDYHEAVNARRLKRELGHDYPGADYNEKVPRYLEWVYTVTTLWRFPPGLPLKKKVFPAVQLAINSPGIQENGGIMIAADGTSMQKYIVKDLQHSEARLRNVVDITGVSITTGDADRPSNTDGFRNVSKNRLIGQAKHLLGEGRLEMNPQLEHAELLIDELRNFLPKRTPANNIVWEADTRENKHDDLILAASLALWLAAKGREAEFGDPMVADISRLVGG